MPSRNVIKEYTSDSFYHLYNRGVAKQPIFRDETDYTVFLGLLKRFLSNEPYVDKYGRLQPHYYGKIELLAFCLMPNHFHLFVFQGSEDKILSKFVQSFSTAYSMYFNRKYKRVGPLFQGRFRASRITKDEYLQHISRYIHLNPKNYMDYQWSSLPYYFETHRSDWVKPQKILNLFEGAGDYKVFLQDYEDHKNMLEDIKYQLADSHSLQGQTLQTP